MNDTFANPPKAARRALLALTAAVLLAHIAVLQANPVVVPGLTQPQHLRTLTTRTIKPTAPPHTTTTAPKPPHASPDKPHQPHRGSLSTTKRPLLWPLPLQPVPAPDPVVETVEPQPPATAPEPTEPVTAPAAAAPEPLNTTTAAPRPPQEAQHTTHFLSVPGSIRLQYKVESNKFPYSLHAELLWQQDDVAYDARLAFSAFGQSRVQTSHGKITPNGLAPVRFSDKYRSEVAAHFDHDKGQVTFSANTPNVPMLAGAQDRLSIFMQLAALLANAPEQYPAGTRISIQTIGPRSADQWLFSVEESETLSLPGGEQVALKLSRHPSKEFDQKVELWLAPALGYLPARVKITENNGDFIDQKWLATEPVK